jgi:hypothetical protein
LITAAANLGAVGAGCLDRPIVTAEPMTKTSFTTVQKANSINKVDLLFDIDNSASMGDKQDYLVQAVPNLITRLVTPNCVDANGMNYGPSSADGNGTCAQGTVEFPPVHDMHIGVLSTSLGTRLSDQYQGGSGIICDPTATVTLMDGTTISNGNDDQAHLLNRSGADQTPLADAGQMHFLNWFPTSRRTRT